MSADDRLPLRFVERRIATLNKCYCVAPFVSADQAHDTFFLVAAEQDDPCYLYGVDGSVVEKLWDAPGGVMSMVQLLERQGRVVLATQEFYGPDNSERAKLVVAVARDAAPPVARGDNASQCVASAWRRFVVAELPFLHRFDVVPGRGAGNSDRYVIACTLKENQSGAGDWSMPGQVLAAKLPDDVCELLPDNWQADGNVTFHTRPLAWRVLKEGCLKNHGYLRHVDPVTSEVNCVIGCDSGTFLFRPPSHGGLDWDVTQLTADPASDAALVDLDDDGREELVVISPFHGDTILVYHKNRENQYERVYTHPVCCPFLHAIWAGRLHGLPCAVLGHRAGNRDLLLLSYSQSRGYHVDVIARDCGPANVTKLTYKNSVSGCLQECLVSCNRETDTVALYDVFAKED